MERPTPATSPTLPWALCTSVFLALAVTAGWKPITSDSEQMCGAAENLLWSGAPYVDSNIRSDIVRGPDGHFFTKYPLMTVVGCAPAVALQGLGRVLGGKDSGLERYFLGIVPACYAALSVLGFFFIARELGFRERLAAIGALLLLFTTPAWHYARSLYSENLQLLIVIWTLWVFLRARGHAPARWLLLGGLLLGVAVNAKVLLAALAIGVVLDRAFDGWQARSWARFVGWVGLGGAPGALAFFWYNHLRYGELLATGYSTGRDGAIGFGSPLLTGLYGLLFSSGKSVFLYAPLLVLGVVGVHRMARERPRDVVFFCVPVALIFVSVAKWWAWSGDQAWGPRLLVPLLGPMFVPVLWALRSAGALQRALAVALALAGLYVGVLGIAIRPFQFVDVAYAAVGRSMGPVVEQDMARDDLVLLHFIPELSPIVGHHWLLHRYFEPGPWTADSYYPWQSLHFRAWAVRKEPRPKYLNFWFARAAHKPTVALNLLALGAALVWLGACWRRARG
jgi:hypothetical protein